MSVCLFKYLISIVSFPYIIIILLIVSVIFYSPFIQLVLFFRKSSFVSSLVSINNNNYRCVACLYMYVYGCERSVVWSLTATSSRRRPGPAVNLGTWPVAPWSRGAGDEGDADRARESFAASVEEPRSAFCAPFSTSFVDSRLIKE